MSRTLTRVGTSWAIIIPASILKKKGYNKETIFDIKEDGDKLILAPKNKASLQLPKLTCEIKILPELQSLAGISSFTEQEINTDPRLKAILDK